jgi:hypothetical protein
MSIYERINNGEYRPQRTYPAYPEKPALLCKRANDLTAEEIAQLHDTKLDWEQCMKDYREARESYGKAEAEINHAFQKDLCDECGVEPFDGPFAESMYAIAWDEGHSAGHSEVASCFMRLLPLWEIYTATLVEPKE